jgi:hypothetical protein
MKKTALFTVFILALLIPATFAFGIVNSAPTYTIPTGPLTPPVISVESPANTTYVSWFVPLKFSINGNWDGFVDHCFVEYSLDGGARYVVFDLPFRVNTIAQNFSITLGPLSEGQHHLQVFATVGGFYRTGENSTTLEANDFTSEAEVYFTVDTNGQAQISILSPQNKTYKMNTMIPVEFTVNTTSSIESMGFTLDEQFNVTIPRNTTIYGPIPDGLHTLRVYSIFSDILPVSSTVNFTVDTTPPRVVILSIQNKEYNTSEIPLDFTVNEPTSQITYILDGRVHTIEGNTTLTGLQDGDHKLIVYARDEVGNSGASETVDFKVEVPIPRQMALVVIPPTAIVLIGGLILVIYFKKRNHLAAKRL